METGAREMLPETIFVMERIHRQARSRGGKGCETCFDNWPSTRLERTAVLLSRWMDGWTGFRRREGDGKPDESRRTWPLQAGVKMFISARLTGMVAASFIWWRQRREEHGTELDTKQLEAQADPAGSRISECGGSGCNGSDARNLSAAGVCR